MAESSAALVLGARPVIQPGGAPPAGTTTVDVVMDDFLFEPLAADLTVPTGKQVTFKIKNKGQAVHNLTSTDFGIKPFDVQALSTGEVTGVAPRPGTYKFVCTYHPGMEGTITVR